MINCNGVEWEMIGMLKGEGAGSLVAKQTQWQPTCQQVLSIIGKRRPRDSSGAPSLLSVFCTVVRLMSIWSCQAVVGGLFIPCLIQRKTEGSLERRKRKRRKEHVLNSNHYPGKFAKEWMATPLHFIVGRERINVSFIHVRLILLSQCQF